MFQGETSITLDDKGRLAIPAAYRDVISRECGNRLTFTYNPFEADTLWIFPTHEWEPIRDQINAMPGVAMSPALQMMQRKLVGAAANLELDSNSRLAVPPTLRFAAGIEKKAVLLGMGNKFELWSEAAHLAKVRQVISPDQITREMMDLKL